MKGATDNKLGDSTYEAREARGLSTVKLAKLVHVHQSTLARIQLGENKRPAPQLLTRIAEALELNPGEPHALAGYTPASELPELKGWLNVKHRGLPEEAARELQGHLDYLVAKHEDKEDDTNKQERKGGT